MAGIDSSGSPAARGRASGHFTIHEEEDGKPNTTVPTRHISSVGQIIEMRP